MRKGLSYIVIVTLLLMATVGMAHAGKTATARMRVSIVGGPLSIQAGDLDFETIDLRTGNNTAFASNSITVNDPTATRAGWHVLARASDLVSSDGTKRIPVEKINLKVRSISKSQIKAHRTEWSPKGVGEVKLTSREKKIVFADKNHGMGVNTITPSYEMSVPYDAPSGEYSGTVQYTLVQGP